MIDDHALDSRQRTQAGAATGRADLVDLGLRIFVLRNHTNGKDALRFAFLQQGAHIARRNAEAIRQPSDGIGQWITHDLPRTFYLKC